MNVANNKTDIILEWAFNAFTTTFTLYRNTDNSTTGFIPITNIAGNLTTLTDKYLNPETTYYYKLKAYNSYGSSDFSDTLSQKTGSIYFR